MRARRAREEHEGADELATLTYPVLASFSIVVDVLGCLWSVTLIAYAPVGVAGLSWARGRSGRPATRRMERLAMFLLWVSFNASFAGMWGATVAQPAGYELTCALVATLLLAQPAALALCLHVVRARRREPAASPDGD